MSNPVKMSGGFGPLREVPFRPEPNISAFSRSTSWTAIDGAQGRYGISRRDPIITPLVTAVLGAVGITNATVISIVSAIAVTAVSLGVQALFAQTPKVPKPADGKAPKAQAVPYRIFCVGTTRLAGAYMLWEAKGDTLYSVLALVGHRISAIGKIFLHDDAVTLDTNGKVQEQSDGRYGNGHITIGTRLGLPTETAFPFIVDALNPEGIWTNSHRGDGQASLGMKCSGPDAEDFQKRYPYGAPQPSVEVDGAKLWDFRDPAQSPTDPSTWTFSRNSVLILAWWECFSEFGSKRNYQEALLPVLDVWKAEANVCDEDVARASGGSEKRYECSGWDTTENDPKAATNAILASCDGWLCERGDGALLITVGKYRPELVTTLTDADLVGHQLETDVLLDEEINKLTPRFNYPATDYTDAVTDSFEDTAAQLEAGRVMSTEGDYRWVTKWRQARRLGKRDWLRARQKQRGTLDVRLSGINSIYSRWVLINAPKRLPTLTGKVIENRRSVLALLQGGFQMDFIEHPIGIDAWTPSTDEGAAPPVPTRPANNGVPTASIDSITVMRSSGSVYLRVAIVAPTDGNYTPMVQYRVKDTGGGVPGKWVPQTFPKTAVSAGLMVVDTAVVPGDTLLEVQAAFKASGGTVGTYGPTPPIQITTTIDTAAPSTPSAFQAPLSGFTVSPSARAGNDNTRALVFKRGTTSQTFAAATLLGRYSVTANQVISLTDTPGTGTWRYWCGAENGSGVASAAQAGPIDVVVP